MRPINLIPPEDRRGERAPLRSGPLAYVIVAVLVLVFVGVYAVVSTQNTISERETELASLEQQLESAQARADALQGFTSFSSLEQARTDTVSTLARSRFDWERVLRELAIVIPAEVSVRELTGAVSEAAESANSGATSSEPINAPTMRMKACAENHDVVARLLASLRDIDGVTRVGLASARKVTALSDTATSAGSSGGECPVARPVSLELTMAFDEVIVDAVTGAVAPTAPEVVDDEGSGVAAAQDERQAAQDSVDSAKDRSSEAVDRFVPGA